MKRFVIGSMVLLLVVAGCGQRGNPTTPRVPLESEAPASNSDFGSDYGNDAFVPTPAPYEATPTPNATSTPAPTATVTPSPSPTATPTPAPTATPGPSPTPSPTPVPADYLTATIVEKKEPGFWIWEKVEVKVQVRNPSFLRTQSGNLVVNFTYKDSIVETQKVPVVLAPAEIRTFTLKSEKRADDATAQVSP